MLYASLNTTFLFKIKPTFLMEAEREEGRKWGEIRLCALVPWHSKSGNNGWKKIFGWKKFLHVCTYNNDLEKSYKKPGKPGLANLSTGRIFRTSSYKKCKK